MAKTIVTHVSPDLDGIPAIWLLRKFHPEFANARVAYVPAGSTYNNEPVDSNPDIVHVDTGLGKFDHHQSDDFTCGAKLVYEWLVKEGHIGDDEALERMIEVITGLDHGYDNYKWPQPEDDRNEFSLHNILIGWKIISPNAYDNYIEWTCHALDAVYAIMKQKVLADGEIEAGEKFNTRWGKGVAIYTPNDAVLDLAIKKGYAVVVRKDPRGGYVRITGSNKKNVDLTRAYEALRQKDPEATWFLHASKVLLRNGSGRNPTMKPSKLGISEVISVLEKA